MYRIIIQIAEKNINVPSSAALRKWAKKTLRSEVETGEVTIRIVAKKEMIELNSTYRHKNKPTNVLSFPFVMPDGIKLDVPILGDIVICAEVVEQEAREQSKDLTAHWAHMVVHGIFHLLGYNHELDSEADIMESLEIKILQGLGFPNPYETGNIRQYE